MTEPGLPPCTPPTLRPPAWACDAHAHVFGPFDHFPLAPERSYEPPQASGPDYLAMLDTLGIGRGVLVQATAHGTDNRALLHALAAAPQRLRGIAVTAAGIADQDLAGWQAAGVRGLRFSHIPDHAGHSRYRNVVGLHDLVQLAPAMRAVGLHAQVWTQARCWPEIEATVLALDLPVVLDHMGRFDVEAGVDAPAFRRLCALLREGRIWVKMTAYRNSARYPGLEDVRPFHDALMAANPQRLVWGSDWPHINTGALRLDPGVLLQAFMRWVGDAQLLARILVDNPARLYGFAQPPAP